MFKVVITDRALKDLDTLTPDIKKRIAPKLKEYSLEKTSQRRVSFRFGVFFKSLDDLFNKRG
jgi:hypothetical protein